MNGFDTYQQLAMRTAKPMEVQDDLLHAALGLTGEAGEFASIPGYEGVYEISTAGVIRRLSDSSTGGHKTGKVMQHKQHKNGYSFITLSKDGKTKDYSIHRLVAATFIPNPEKKSTVNHIDGDRRNNCVDNLEWATYSENISHSYKKLGRIGPRGEVCGKSKLTESDVVEIRARRILGESYKSISKSFGVSGKQISVVARGVQWSHI